MLGNLEADRAKDRGVNQTICTQVVYQCGPEVIWRELFTGSCLTVNCVLQGRRLAASEVITQSNYKRNVGFTAIILTKHVPMQQLLQFRATGITTAQKDHDVDSEHARVYTAGICSSNASSAR